MVAENVIHSLAIVIFTLNFILTMSCFDKMVDMNTSFLHSLLPKLTLYCLYPYTDKYSHMLSQNLHSEDEAQGYFETLKKA